MLVSENAMKKSKAEKWGWGIPSRGVAILDRD